MNLFMVMIDLSEMIRTFSRGKLKMAKAAVKTKAKAMKAVKKPAAKKAVKKAVKRGGR